MGCPPLPVMSPLNICWENNERDEKKLRNNGNMKRLGVMWLGADNERQFQIK